MSLPNQDPTSSSPEFPEVEDSKSPFQSYHFDASIPTDKNAVEDPRATTGYQKLTRPIEVRPNRNYLEAKGAARGGDVDFPSFDSEFRTLYGKTQGYHVGGGPLSDALSEWRSNSLTF